MIKTGIETPSYERTFIRQALFGHGIRLDGRGAQDCRELSFSLDRGECCASSRVQLGSTLVYAIVTGEIVAPYPDRPVEGVLQFSASVSSKMESAAGTAGGAGGGGAGGGGVASWEITRMLERAVRESESLDTESLCIVGGEWVWQLTTEVRVIDGSGGNIVDACVMAAMSAMRAFRKPDVTVVGALDEAEAEGEVGVCVGGVGSGSVGFNDCVEFNSSSDTKANADSTTRRAKGKGAKGAQGAGIAGGAGAPVNIFEAVAQKSSRIVVHSSHDREPLPLALHHTPLSITMGILTPAIVATTTSASEDPEQLLPAKQAEGESVILLADPSREEEQAVDGKIIFSINAHSELCSIHKPAGRGLSAATIVKAAKAASQRALLLHQSLAAALQTLEQSVAQERERRQITQRTYNQLEQERHGWAGTKATVTFTATKSDKKGKFSSGGIDRNDPILEWSKLHQPAGLWETG
ncbi:ribosomal protein S5 domain 2-type protein [Ochromonadaceae sp. CCMP2298]|nr:ribosomal protein S5 domain 2-type protein [Ochromonadaceae sp. CCMP2298]